MPYYGRKQVDPFYRTNAWRVVRELALQRDLGMCQDCLREYQRGERDNVRPATMVHHIRPIRECWEKRLELENLVSLCDKHHEARHPERHGEQKAPLPAGVRVVTIRG